MTVRVRVGPSLKRPFTLGALRFALFNHAFAESSGGSFLVRIEDVDGARSEPALLDDLYDGLAWTGVRYHEGGRLGGPFGPYRQSARLPTYHEHARVLLDAGRAYRCFCTPERLARTRGARPGGGYDRRCAGLDPAAARRRAGGGEPSVVRMRVPRDAGPVRVVHDGVHGDVTLRLDGVDDQVLLKSDGFPTHHFASVVDDHLMRVSDVVRADVWLVSTPKHLLLHEWFGWTPPRYHHVPSLRGPMWSTPVHELRRRGVPADAVVNFLAALGRDGRRMPDVFTLREFVAGFDPAGFARTCGRTDPRRLEWLSARHLRRRPLAEADGELLPHLRAAGLPAGSAARRREALRLARPHCRTYGEVVARFGYLFTAPAPTAAAVRAAAPLRDRLGGLFDDLSGDPGVVADHLAGIAAAWGVGLHRLLTVVRLAVCGVASAPDTYAVLAFLGRDECASRMDAVLGAAP